MLYIASELGNISSVGAFSKMDLVSLS